ncbi:YdhK family protein [Virgibacillus halophilus]|uniref:YdhK family protein n=1 Tax=Tigheibacillus halophilus TaxID=361280 RepID=A0ABU5C758_9BACI|nr:YdhK family protein [Virgibacillus halophilus]
MKKQLFAIVTAAIIGMAGCNSGPKGGQSHENGQKDDQNISHQHADDALAETQGLKEAENPTYPVGSEAIVKSGHMAGMKGAKASIVGAYDTTVYEVAYKPTTGGKTVRHHKWIVQSEIKKCR